MREKQQKILHFLFNDPKGEEILEGVTGGTLAGISQIGSDKTPEEIGMQTIAGIGGGIGLGMAGRRIGANIGKSLHAKPLKDQEGLLAGFGRLLCNEGTTLKGFEQQTSLGKKLFKQHLVNDTSANLMHEALVSPEKFYKSYGIPAEQFKNLEPLVKQGQMASEAASMYKKLSPEKKEVLSKKILQNYKDVEDLIMQKASGSVDQKVKKAKDIMGSISTETDTEEMLKNTFSDFLQGLSDEDINKVTGENVGRATGRFIGDELGILGGMGAAGLLANQMGLVSPKDKKITRLEEQISQLKKR